MTDNVVAEGEKKAKQLLNRRPDTLVSTDFRFLVHVWAVILESDYEVPGIRCLF